MQRGLIVEDSSDTAEWLRLAMAEVEPELSLDHAPTVARAAEFAANQRYRIALVDLSLPDGCGDEVVRLLRKRDAQTAILVVTIHDDDAHLFAALQAGANGYLLKDMPRRRFVEKLRGLLSGEPALSPAIASRLIDYFHADGAPVAHPLTSREIEVLTLIAKGLKVPQVATQLGISANTVAGYVKEIYRKLGVSSRAEASLKAARMGLV